MEAREKRARQHVPRHLACHRCGVGAAGTGVGKAAAPLPVCTLHLHSASALCISDLHLGGLGWCAWLGWLAGETRSDRSTNRPVSQRTGASSGKKRCSRALVVELAATAASPSMGAARGARCGRTHGRPGGYARAAPAICISALLCAAAQPCTLRRDRRPPPPRAAAAAASRLHSNPAAAR